MQRFSNSLRVFPFHPANVSFINYLIYIRFYFCDAREMDSVDSRAVKLPGRSSKLEAKRRKLVGVNRCSRRQNGNEHRDRLIVIAKNFDDYPILEHKQIRRGRRPCRPIICISLLISKDVPARRPAPTNCSFLNRTIILANDTDGQATGRYLGFTTS